jgi:hypothetical protein
MIETEIKKTPRKKSDNPHYVSNKQLTTELVRWLTENKHHITYKEVNGKQVPIYNRDKWSEMPNYVAESILKLISRYALQGKYRGYTYIDEMKSEALLNCIKYCHNFDTTKTNAFAYLTQYVTHSFWQVIAKEKHQAAIKFKSISEQSIYNNDRINLYDEEEEEH